MLTRAMRPCFLTRSRFLLLALVSVGGAHTAPELVAQTVAGGSGVSARNTVSSNLAASNIIVPQRRVYQPHSGGAAGGVIEGAIEISGVRAEVSILEQVATTTLSIQVQNRGRRRAEAELLVPVPEGAVVRGFEFRGDAKEPTARLLPKDEARELYNSIVRRWQDPALLEFAGYNLVRSSVFPVEPRGGQEVRLTYEHLLQRDGERIDYVLPRTEALDYRVPWSVSVKIQSAKPIATVYSPSHAIESTRVTPQSFTIQTAAAARREPGTFRLSYLLESKELSASLFAYPDPRVGGGYFLLLAAAPGTPPASSDVPAIRREITLVLDRSGSMAGEKIQQVREAARQIIAGMNPGETFNILTYNEAVEPFAPKPVVKDSDSETRAGRFLDEIQARGGTNIHDALLEALRPTPKEGHLPIVLFLTDGLPTIGQTSESAIRDLATQQNPHARRIFTLGVGFDVNAPLLERLASVSRADATYVLPKENVEVKVAQVFRRLAGPVLAAPRLSVVGEDNVTTVERVRDLAPSTIPDLFEGEQLIVLGTYRGSQPLNFVLDGNYRGAQRKFQFSFPLDQATTRNAFVPRLWASRKIGFLEDAVRDLGADPSAPVAANDPRLKELVDEIVRLSTEFGILSEYTAFLARDGTRWGEREHILNEANSNFYRRSVQSRVGQGGVNQALNRKWQKAQSYLKMRNDFLDTRLNRVTVSNVQQIADKAFFQQQGRWIDSRLAAKSEPTPPQRVIDFDSDEFRQLIAKLVQRGQQGFLSLRGDVLLEIDGDVILVRAPKPAGTAAPTPAPSAAPATPRSSDASRNE